MIVSGRDARGPARRWSVRPARQSWCLWEPCSRR